MRLMIRLPQVAAPTGWVLATLLPCALLSAAAPSETRSVLKEWVQVKAMISEETEDWAAEKATLGDTIALLKEEKAMLEEQIEAREEAAAAAVDQRTTLSVRKEELDAQASELGSILTEYERAVTDWIGVLPDFLTQELAPLIRRLPNEDTNRANIGLARRLQTIVGILSQADKFNSTLSVRNELRAPEPGGSERETSTLYFGLGYAVFADAEGDLAGYGTPTDDGWEWTTVPEAAPAIHNLIAIYKNEKPADYVEIPLFVD